MLTLQGGGWHTYDIFSRLLKERIICLNGEGKHSPIHDTPEGEAI